MSTITEPTLDGAVAGRVIPEAARRLEQLRQELHRVVVGQERVLERVLVSLLAGGHCLLEGVPGLGKTLTVATLAQTLGGTFHRIQFTPDLIPSDLVGTRIYRPSTERFDVELGPVFANFILADEINRAPAKVQSALLEVMAERQVSLAGTTYPVPRPFLVLATQNPIESEGVYPLPEAQRDRFLMRIPVDYPTAVEEHTIVGRASWPTVTPDRILTVDDVIALQDATTSVHVDPAVQDYAVRLVLATRHPLQHGVDDVVGYLAYGASPRASIGLVHAARALALIRGRAYALPQDVYDIAYDVMNHRLVLSFDAVAEGVTVDDVLVATLTKVTAPRLATADLARAAGLTAGCVMARPIPTRTPAHPSQAPVDLLQLTVLKRLDGLLQGDHAGLLPGHGTETGEARPYVPGDDPRRIDWAVTARTADTYVRDTIADHELELWIVLDTSASLAFGTAESEKSEVAWAAAGAFALLASRGGNRVAAITAGGRRTVFPPRSGRAHVGAVLAGLRRQGADGDTDDLGAASTVVRRLVPRRGMVVVVSDFLEPDGWQLPLRLLAARHELLAIEVVDQRELELPDVGLLAVVDPETGRRRYVDTQRSSVRERFAIAAREQRAGIAAHLTSAGADHLVVRTDRDWVVDLVRFVGSRKARRLAASGRR